MKKSSNTRLAGLSQKLLRVRLELGLSQNEMLERLGFSKDLFRSNISQYELGTREPPLPVILQYARLANVYADALLDDELDLPETLPANPKSEGIRRKKPSRNKS